MIVTPLTSPTIYPVNQHALTKWDSRLEHPNALTQLMAHTAPGRVGKVSGFGVSGLFGLGSCGGSCGCDGNCLGGGLAGMVESLGSMGPVLAIGAAFWLVSRIQAKRKTRRAMKRILG